MQFKRLFKRTQNPPSKHSVNLKRTECANFYGGGMQPARQGIKKQKASKGAESADFLYKLA